MSGTQLPLDLGHRTALSDGDFLVAPCNADAYAWLERWPRWPGPASVIFGPAQCGKTHLAHLFATRSGAVALAAAALTVADPPCLLAQAHAVVVEDCDRAGGDGEGLDETALFHLINLTKESGGFLLLTGREAPSRWKIGLPDLRSRLNAMAALAIGAPRRRGPGGGPGQAVRRSPGEGRRGSGDLSAGTHGAQLRRRRRVGRTSRSRRPGRPPRRDGALGAQGAGAGWRLMGLHCLDRCAAGRAMKR